MSQLLKSRYTLDECYTALDIHPKTFRIWLKEGGITPETSKADRRIKFLTAAQVERLAWLHDKPWPPVAGKQEPEVLRPEAYKLLLEQLAEADQQAQRISAAQAELQASIAELREQREATTRQLAAIEQVQREQAEKESQERAALQEQGQQTRAALDSLTTSQQEAAAHLDELVGASEQQRKLLEAMQASQQEAAARLDTLAAEGSEHAERLAQFIARMDKQDQRHAQLAGRVDELAAQAKLAKKEMQEQLGQIKAAMQEQLQQALTGLKAEYQAALHVLRQEMQATREQQARDLYAAIHSVEQDEARDVQQLTAAQEQQRQRLEQLTGSVEQVRASVAAASVAAQNSERRLEGAEQQLNALDKRLQIERVARESLTQRLEEYQQPREPRKKSARRPGDG